MKNIITLSLGLFLTVALQAQDWSGNVYKIGKIYPGYYITTKGDTVNGYFYHGSQTENQTTCLYYKNETDKKHTSKFKPEDLKEWKVADKLYRSIQYSGGLLPKPYRFNLVVKDGPICEYIFYDEMGTGETKSVFHKAHDPANSKPVELQSFGLKFAKKMSEYVADYKELSEKVASKADGYGMLKILDIIKEYNEWYLKK